MQLISQILPTVLKRRGMHVLAKATEVSRVAEGWINKELPTVAIDLHVGTLKHGILTIESKSSIAAQECQQFILALKEYLMEKCGEKAVSEIRLIRKKARNT